MRRSWVGAAAVAFALVVAGCTGPSTPPTSTSAPGGPSGSSAPSPAAVSVEVSSGPVTLAVSAPQAATLTPDDSAGAASTPGDSTGPGAEGTRQLSVPLPATITLTSGGSFARNVDGTVTIQDDGGTAIGGLSAPVAAGSASGARLSVTGPTVLSLDASSGQGARAALTLGTAGLLSATWGVYDGGRSLAVDPTPWARHGGMAALDTAWAQLVAAQPEADTDAMHDQFTCHAIGAPDKTTWNLEPWRPDVGLAATLAAKCNPS